MAQDPSFDILSATTLADLRRDAVQDNFFVDGAWQRVIRYYASLDPYTGGLFMQEPFMYNRVAGGAAAAIIVVLLVAFAVVRRRRRRVPGHRTCSRSASRRSGVT